MYSLIRFLLFVLLPVGLLGNTVPKSVGALRILEKITVDGNLDEDSWLKAENADQFVENQPDPGSNPEFPSTVKILYDNSAIYIGAELFIESESDVLKELTLRDRFGNSDVFSVYLCPYKDGINGFAFKVTAAGVQLDAKLSSQGDDYNWNDVWWSEVKIDKRKWTVEIKIPYSALRFPDKQVQEWQINFERYMRKTRETSYWNEVDPEKDGFLNQAGTLQGIENIVSPVRLSVTPFVVTNVSNSFDKQSNPKSNWESDISGGMDLKYGINDAFTLDMTLIPDFSQARSDDQILNLSPFEVRFDENRSFFTEGIELFSKGNVFYSRRVGGRPIGFNNAYDEAKEGEEVILNPNTTRLYNALKVSGRNASNLGIGVFNAITGETYATLENEEGEQRKVKTAPLSNYNMVVFDQSFKNNSYVSLFNTNVWRDGDFVNANVTGTEFQLNDKGQKYGAGGSFVLTQRSLSGSTELGHRWNLRLEKLSGKIVGGVSYWEESDTYNPNDMGFNLSPNDRSINTWLRYRIFEPFGSFNRMTAGLNVNYKMLYKPAVFSDFGINLWTFLLGKNNAGYEFWTYIEPVETRDYFEPRTEDFSRYYAFPTSWNVGQYYSSNFNKKVAVSISSNYRNFKTPGRYRLNFEIEPRLRVSDKFNFSLGLASYNTFKDDGYVSPNESSVGYESVGSEDIIFGTRNQKIFETELNINYIFTNKMGLTFRARHYWSTVDYKSFSLLDDNGYLAETAYRGVTEEGMKLHDQNFNAFNIDFIYSWRFAPGSDIIFVWKNSILNSGDDSSINYIDNLKFLSDSPQLNTFSLKVLYFLDYHQVIGQKKLETKAIPLPSYPD